MRSLNQHLTWLLAKRLAHKEDLPARLYKSYYFGLVESKGGVEQPNSGFFPLRYRATAAEG
jgi:hypothetical protein